ncbi:PREDICTED: NEDD8-activating enzyme E1 regulatory subunit [Nicrophorus vespilloides]|uniref:NEDD8-activating enzyme E1 regulatory subunit n=1 Tax=Nicrophorus vespilloides TaxID=110193 RepID=A0ABM1M4X1_NICVS|nr:PREDICTED: NEDD8-activating enzyme E1 regulatory subunit [Nicrophorus vespilloides]
MSSPAPKSPEQSEKSKKYDRQLRLWGDHGQRFLENSKVCLINATALGTEILKSLVLPGIGSFTIIDGEKVTEEDIGSNFFLDNDSLGNSRAQAATMCLLELNPDVRGDYIDEFPENVMKQNQDFLKGFSVVIATALPEKFLIPLSKQLWDAGIPLFSCKSIGLLGYARLQVNEHTVIEVHPDNDNPDLRLDEPWPALKEHLESFDISKLDKKERSHVPALIILYYFMQKFRNLHDGALPTNRAEKDQLRNMIRACGNEEGLLEENFEEAIHYVNTCLSHSKISSQVQSILDDPKCLNLNQDSAPFWVMVSALRELVQTEGSLPVKGSLPDMAADTNSYITLQQIYQKRFNEQVETVQRRVSEILRNVNQSPDAITEDEIKLFCKHANELYIVRGTCIADEYQSSTLDISMYLDDPDSLMMYYVILRGLDRFLSEFNAYPGQFDDQVEPDVVKLKSTIGKLLAEWGCGQVLRDERVHEVCRYGGAEMHSISAILGGCVAHEVIKLITHQYKPLNNTFIFDAITSNSVTYRL